MFKFKRTIGALAAVLAVAALASPAALADGGNGNSLPAQVCVSGPGGQTIDIDPETDPRLLQLIATALNRGTAWLAENNGQTFILLSGAPDPEEGWTNIREVSFTEGACAASGPGVVFMPMPARVGVCSSELMLRADGTMGIYQDITIGEWLDPDSPYFGMPAAKFAKGGPVNGTTCDNLPGYTATGNLVDGSGGQGGGDGQVYPEYVFNS